MITNILKAALGRWQLSLGILAAFGLCLTLAYCQGRSDGRSKLLLEQAEARAEKLQDARKADAVAHDAVAQDKALSGAEIERGREAAEDAEDPWKAATEAMR